MLVWIFSLAALVVGSAILGLGHVVPLASGAQNAFLTLTAILAVILIASWDAFETQKAPVSKDDDR